MALDQGRENRPQVGSTCHPLEVVPSTVQIRAIELAAGKVSLDPEERPFVAHVHSQRYVGLSAVAPEVAFADQQADEEALYEGPFHVKHDGETIASSPLVPQVWRLN